MGDVVPIVKPENQENYWVCACVKRDRKGRMTHIKENHRSVAKCRRCGCTRDESDAVQRQVKK